MTVIKPHIRWFVRRLAIEVFREAHCAYAMELSELTVDVEIRRGILQVKVIYEGGYVVHNAKTAMRRYAKPNPSVARIKSQIVAEIVRQFHATRDSKVAA